MKPNELRAALHRVGFTDEEIDEVKDRVLATFPTMTETLRRMNMRHGHDGYALVAYEHDPKTCVSTFTYAKAGKTEQVTRLQNRRHWTRADYFRSLKRDLRREIIVN